MRCGVELRERAGHSGQIGWADVSAGDVGEYKSVVVVAEQAGDGKLADVADPCVVMDRGLGCRRGEIRLGPGRLHGVRSVGRART